MPDTHSLIKHFAQLTDPRIERSKRHALGDILIISICALLCGAEGFAEMALRCGAGRSSAKPGASG